MAETTISTLGLYGIELDDTAVSQIQEVVNAAPLVGSIGELKSTIRGIVRVSEGAIDAQGAYLVMSKESPSTELAAARKVEKVGLTVVVSEQDWEDGHDNDSVIQWLTTGSWPELPIVDPLDELLSDSGLLSDDDVDEVEDDTTDEPEDDAEGSGGELPVGDVDPIAELEKYTATDESDDNDADGDDLENTVDHSEGSPNEEAALPEIESVIEGPSDFKDEYDYLPGIPEDAKEPEAVTDDYEEIDILPSFDNEVEVSDGAVDGMDYLPEIDVDETSVDDHELTDEWPDLTEIDATTSVTGDVLDGDEEAWDEADSLFVEDEDGEVGPGSESNLTDPSDDLLDIDPSELFIDPDDDGTAGSSDEASKQADTEDDDDFDFGSLDGLGINETVEPETNSEDTSGDEFEGLDAFGSLDPEDGPDDPFGSPPNIEPEKTREPADSTDSVFGKLSHAGDSLPAAPKSVNAPESSVARSNNSTGHDKYIDNMVREADRLRKADRGVINLITGPQGGVGKSTMAFVLAQVTAKAIEAYFARTQDTSTQRREVWLIEADYESPKFISYMDLDASTSSHNHMKFHRDLEAGKLNGASSERIADMRNESIASCVTRDPDSGLFIVPCPIDTSDYTEKDAAHLRRAIAEIVMYANNKGAHVFVDMDNLSNTEPLHRSLTKIANFVIMVSVGNNPSIELARRSIKSLIKKDGGMGVDQKKIGVFLNKTSKERAEQYANALSPLKVSGYLPNLKALSGADDGSQGWIGDLGDQNELKKITRNIIMFYNKMNPMKEFDLIRKSTPVESRKPFWKKLIGR